MKHETIEEIEARFYPPEKRFVCEFKVTHLLTTGKWSDWRGNRRFFLSDNAEQATTQVLKELEDPEYWPPGSHRWKDLVVRNVPKAAPYVGYVRFSGVNDIRTKTQ